MTEPVRIGDATLYCGDCREIMPSLRADAVVTDPPYGIAHKRGVCANRGKGVTVGTDGIDGDDAPFDPSPLLAFPAAILWGANFYADKLPGGRWLIWDKQEHGGSGDFSEAEIAWCSKPGALKFFRHMWLGVQRASEVGEARFHPMQKPIMLMEWCLGFLPEARTILDPYMGSAPVGCACVGLGRSYIGIEIDPRHFETACRRIEREYEQLKLFPPAPPRAAPVQEELAI
jgi:site-specific DNA-methyltransferase (adenine-specific)/modification methylase